jgi:hypothetical protein
MTDLESPCKPGDITVTAIHGGFLIGRVLPKLGLGPWWEYLKTVRDRRTAFLEARLLANARHVRAWVHPSADEYVLIAAGHMNARVK